VPLRLNGLRVRVLASLPPLPLPASHLIAGELQRQDFELERARAPRLAARHFTHRARLPPERHDWRESVQPRRGGAGAVLPRRARGASRRAPVQAQPPHAFLRGRRGGVGAARAGGPRGAQNVRGGVVLVGRRQTPRSARLPQRAAHPRVAGGPTHSPMRLVKARVVLTHLFATLCGRWRMFR
jgi:hypothetical protein